MMKVVVSGAAGKMGQEVCRTVIDDPELQLVGAVDLPELVVQAGIGCDESKIDIGSIIGRGTTGINISTDLEETIKQMSADVVVDFTVPSAVMENIEKIVNAGIDGVIGTTGIDEERLDRIKEFLRLSDSHIFIAPNFAIGAILMMDLAQRAAKHLNAAEIIELHHETKVDAPSGTAISTANKISAAKGLNKIAGNENVVGARGGDVNGVKVHSVRLPGLVAHQEVIFGAQGQTLIIRHDSTDRTSFMPGVVMAVKAIRNLPPLTVGLETLMGLE